jgi:hypothetical protein
MLRLGLPDAAKASARPIRDWPGAMNQFSIIFESHMPTSDILQISNTQNF